MSILKSDMIQGKVKATIRKYSLLNPGERIVVAVSGGPDSVCLLSALQSLSKEFHLSLHIAHLNHMFRGRESEDDARFVAALAERFGIPSTIAAIDVPAFCRERGLSAQAGAREVRYGFFSRVAVAVNATRIATGHTANDQAETFLLRLMRGAGVSGLSAIPPKRDNIIRPMIEVTREEVHAYLQLNNLGFVSDPSNTKPVYARNRIRMNILPVLKEFNPRIIKTLSSEAALLRDEDEATEALLKTVADDIIEQNGEKVIIKRDRFNSLPPAHKRRVLKKAIERAGGESSRLSSAQIEEAVLFMVQSQSGRQARLPFDFVLEREYDKFIIRPQTVSQFFSYTLAVPGRTRIPEFRLEVETDVEQRKWEPAGLTANPVNGSNYFWQALFDYDRIQIPLIVRNRRPGDRLFPAGMGGKSKKLQDFFVDAKIPRNKRDAVPLLVAGDDILWVIGMRTDERFLPGPGTKRVLIATARPIG